MVNYEDGDTDGLGSGVLKIDVQLVDGLVRSVHVELTLVLSVQLVDGLVRSVQIVGLGDGLTDGLKLGETLGEILGLNDGLTDGLKLGEREALGL